MISGSIDNFGQPRLIGYVRMPRIAVIGVVEFLVDTGSPSTIISPTDAKNLGIDHQNLRGPPVPMTGFGGTGEFFCENATLYFRGSDNLTLDLCMGIIKPYEGSDKLPSIIGRDVLRSWKTVYEPLNEVAPLQFFCSGEALSW